MSASIVQSDAVEYTPDFARILSLPRRTWEPNASQQLVEWLTPQLRSPLGEMVLRPIQAIALYELSQVRGLFGIIRVGAGKTLISLLARFMVPCQRPLLVVKAALVEKTKHEMRELSRHWHVPRDLRIVSYELFGPKHNARLLENYRPDLIICDEVHKIRDMGRSRSKRFARYFAAHPETMFVAMSGTMTKRSIRDYARFLRWSLKPTNAPIPQLEGELEEWCNAIDERVNPIRRLRPGALLYFVRPEDANTTDALSATRRGYGRRLTETPGVVATQETPIDCSLLLRGHELTLLPVVEQAFAKLRSDWLTPDDWPIADASQQWRHARELGLEFYLRWNPRPPEWWYIPRAFWAHCCRQALNHSRSIDSEGQLAQAITLNQAPRHVLCSVCGVGGEERVKHDIYEAYQAWKAVENGFIPKTECVWLGYTALQFAAEWAAKAPGIIWCEHVEFARTLSRGAGIPYYGQGGVEWRSGQPIEKADPKRPCIASIRANSEGRNLQFYHRNLITSLPPNGPDLEQLLARTHREGQKADEVTFDVLMTCIEHYAGLEQAKRDAELSRDTIMQLQKVLCADHVFEDLSEVMGRTGPRWNRDYANAS